MAGVKAGFRVPTKTDRRGAIQARHQGARALRCRYFQVECVATAIALLVEANLHHRSFAGDDESLLLAIGVAVAVAKHEPNGIGPVLHVGGSEETRLPDIFGG